MGESNGIPKGLRSVSQLAFSLNEYVNKYHPGKLREPLSAGTFAGWVANNYLKPAHVVTRYRKETPMNYSYFDDREFARLCLIVDRLIGNLGYFSPRGFGGELRRAYLAEIAQKAREAAAKTPEVETIDLDEIELGPLAELAPKTGKYKAHGMMGTAVVASIEGVKMVDIGGELYIAIRVADSPLFDSIKARYKLDGVAIGGFVFNEAKEVG